ncbi:CMD domain protein [Terrarubrum flagellatum]|uniref:CMD domain protein n=1 Tax=Terrirubrum flagellatum TaxID=2895980 RepID=UPI0031450A3B
MNAIPDDVIDHLAGVAPGSSLDEIRSRRAQARENAQKSFLALFAPDTFDEMSAQERYAVALFVSAVHGAAKPAGFYGAGLAKSGASPALAQAVSSEAAKGKTSGPYGAYPAGPLSAEDKKGLIYRASDGARTALGLRLAAALEHAHLLVFRPRDANPDVLQALLDAGWSSTGIVTLSQLVAFLAFQIRVVAGLQILGARTGAAGKAA